MWRWPCCGGCSARGGRISNLSSCRPRWRRRRWRSIWRGRAGSRYRHLKGDVALALLRRLQRTRRPDLKLVVMSATLEAAPVAQYLAGKGRQPLPVLRSAGRQHQLEIEYTPHSAAPVEDQVAAALQRVAV